MPGFVNAHTHLSMTLLRGLGGGLKLQDWLEKKIWPAEDKLREGHCYWGSMLGLLEMIRTGTTAFLDMYFFMEETARAVEETGMRAVLSRGIIGNAPNYESAMAEGEALFQDFNGAADGRITVMLGPHAEYTNNEKSIRAVVELAHKLGCGIHVHLQETSSETAGCYARYGMSPAQRLEKLGLFTSHTVAAHCVAVSAEDVDILRRNGVSVAHNPGSNLKLASGIAPVKALLDAGVVVALGTDGAASNDNLDMLEEARLAALLAKLRENDATALGAHDALKLATVNGAKALGIDSVSGSIEVGKDADIIIISESSPSLHPKIDEVSNIVYSASARDVSMTMVKGRILMEDFDVKGLDPEKIVREADRISAAVCS
jgi:5-methylthioadenosine/S-adenosylhomocysteine deaminase